MTQEDQTISPTPIQEFTDLILNSSPKEQYREFIKVPKDKRGEVFLDLPENVQFKFGKRLKIGTLLAMFRFLDPDEIADFLEMLPEARANKVKRKLDENLKKKVEYRSILVAVVLFCSFFIVKIQKFQLLPVPFLHT